MPCSAVSHISRLLVAFCCSLTTVNYLHLHVLASLIVLTPYVCVYIGDRSQIATIALAASKNPFGVVLGGLVGHAFCTGLAVIGGKMLAAKISERTVAIIGGILFLIFGVTSIFFGPDDL